MRWLARANSVLVRLCAAGAVVCLAAMTLAILAQVVFRYGLNAPLSWPEEAARFLMVWMTFLVAPHAYRESQFVRLESGVVRLPPRARRVVETGVHIAVIVLLIVLLREGIWLVERGTYVRASAFDVSMAWIFAVMPVSFGLTISCAIESIGGLWSSSPAHATPSNAE